jgi:hypothetical protein
MSKPCSICSAPQGVQDKILELAQKGEPQREIESVLFALFNLKISHTAIGRHLKHCIERDSLGHNSLAEEEDEVLDIHLLDEEDLPPENTQLHQELCKVLTNSVRIFHKRMRETASSSVPYGAHLDSIKALDTLINAFDKLYINPKEGRSQDQKRADLSDLQLKIIHDVMTEDQKDNPDALKNTVLKTFESHQNLMSLTWNTPMSSGENENDETQP